MKSTAWSIAVALAAACVVTFVEPAAARTVGSGRVVSESRPAADFDSIAASASIDVVVRQAAKEAVTVEAEDNILPLVETVVEPSGAGKRLVIRFRKGESISTHKPVKVSVDVVRLSGLSMAGSGDVQVKTLKSPSFKLSLSGSSDASLSDLTIDAFELSISGSSDVVAAGRAGKVSISIAGSGDAKMFDLMADDVRISIAGSGDAEVHADKSLEVSAAGSGEVVWTGNATQVKSRIAGSGSLTKK